MKTTSNSPEIAFSHLVFEEGESFLVEAAKLNYIIFFTKGRASSGEKRYATGDIAFFPVSFDFTVTFALPGEVLAVCFDNTPDVFKEIQKLLVVHDGSSSDEESSGYLKIKYPLNIYVMLITRYIEDKILTPDLAFFKLAELFTIFNRYYDEREIRDLFLPIVSALPEFRLLVYSKLKYDQNVDELASACNMGKRSFERKFSEAFNGQSPYEWIQKQKEKKILYKMSLPGVTIKDIIEEFNFYDSSHFNKFCKQRYHKNPQEIIKSFSIN